MAMRGNGSLYLRGTTWWMKFYRDGRPVSMSCKTESRDQAATKLRKELRKSDDEFTEPRYKRVTVGDLVGNLLQNYDANGLNRHRVDSLSRWNNHLAPRFKDTKAATFGSAHQQTYRAERLKQGASPVTVNRELQILRKAFKLGAESEPALVKRVPKFQIVKEDNARRQFASSEQVTALKIAAANESLEMRVIVEMALIFGWRRGELLRLTVKDFHLAENTVRLEDSKNGDAREAPMTAALRTLVTGLLAGRAAEAPLWSHSVRTFEATWHKVTKAAGCSELLFHDLRRTSARTKRAAGVDTSVTMEMMGWKTEQMFRRYGIVGIEDKISALAKQEAYEKAQTANSYKTATLGAGSN